MLVCLKILLTLINKKKWIKCLIDNYTKMLPQLDCILMQFQKYRNPLENKIKPDRVYNSIKSISTKRINWGSLRPTLKIWFHKRMKGAALHKI